MKTHLLRVWLATGLLVLGCFTTSAQSLINVNLGAGIKVGSAAIGLSTNDFWNSYYPTNSDGTLFDPSQLIPLYSADSTNTTAAMFVWNVSLAGTNTTGDAMFDSWLAASGTNLYVTLTNVPYGSYDFYVYGHGDSNELNSIVKLQAAWSDYGTTNTTTTGDWSTNVWTEGAQYVVFRDVMIPQGQNVQITIEPNSGGLAVLNGFQLVSRSIPANRDTDGDGLTDLDELQRGTNPFSVDTDGDGASDAFEVLKGSDPLVANVAFSYSTGEDTVLTIGAPGVISADPRYQSNTNLTATLGANVGHGTLALAQNGTFSYQPGTNFAGLDGFTFTVSDGTNQSQSWLVLIDVTPINDPPVATGQLVITVENTATSITLAGSDVDGDALTYTVVRNPAHGTLSGTGPNVLYSPTAGYNGPDSFTYKVNDGLADSELVAVTIMVTCGRVVAWGDNSAGQTNIPVGLSRVTTVAAGGYHNAALRSDGTVVAWGSNSNGQTTVPTGLNGVTAIAAGFDHTLALKNDGTVVAWGNNAQGQTSVPEDLSGVTAIVAKGFHSLALKSDGTVAAWGYNYYGQATVPTGLSGVTAIAAGFRHSLALKDDGTVVAWGDGSYGQTTVPAGLTGVVAIAGGGYHSLALKSDGTVVAWGLNNQGQTTVPTGLSEVKAIAADYEHTLTLKNDGTVVAWGNNAQGQTTVPAGVSNATAIAAGSFHSLVVVSSAPVLINVNFGSGSKVGAAAIGWGASDFWNTYNPTNNDGSLFEDGVQVPLLSALGTNVGAGVLVYNVQARGTNSVGDAMFDSYLAATNGTNLTIILTNVPFGLYDVVVYAHGQMDELNATMELTSGWSSYGPKSTTTSSDWNSALWTEDAQYVVFQNVAVPKGRPLVIQVQPSANGIAAINGIQLVSKAIPDQDSDNDGLSDADELARGTNPYSADTDGDGLSDGDEINIYGTNPLLADTDGDGLSDGEEVNTYGTNPLLADSDGDGLSDGDEVKLYHTNPLSIDTDYDGVSDSQEIADGTNPLNPESVKMVILGRWRMDSTNWIGDQGQLPSVAYGLTNVPGCISNAICMDSTNGVLRYHERDNVGLANVNCRNGSVRLWYKPQWAGTNVGGNGPGQPVRLFEVGRKGGTDTNGWWGMWIDATGTTLNFGARTGSELLTYAVASIAVQSNEWHEITLSYTPSNSVIYVDGLVAGTGSGAAIYPSAAARQVYGLGIGSDESGAYPARGCIDHFETFNYPIYQDDDDDGLSNIKELAIGTDPRRADTDGDGVGDGVELALGRNPLISGIVTDTSNSVVRLQVHTPLE